MRAFVPENVQEGFRILGSKAQLAFQGQVPLLELILVLEPYIEPLQIGLVPEEIGLFSHLHTAHHTLLDEQRDADVSQEVTALAGSATFIEVNRKGLDKIEGSGHPCLVVLDHYGFRECIGNDLDIVHAEMPHVEDTIHIDFVCE